MSATAAPSGPVPAMLGDSRWGPRLARILDRWAEWRAAWTAPSALDQQFRIAMMSYGQIGLAARPTDLRDVLSNGRR